MTRLLPFGAWWRPPHRTVAHAPVQRPGALGGTVSIRQAGRCLVVVRGEGRRRIEVVLDHLGGLAAVLLLDEAGDLCREHRAAYISVGETDAVEEVGETHRGCVPALRR
ncbi:hypothetical protein ACFUIW_29055 [Streptomyces sp. NPDC057245]|uniref:hypothetical protein n=1 Tax=Streptomyces TaxID=1883 RepID=UPI001C1E7258|nr:hypothetical protein [Streptomyces sp. A108]MBU6530094.1 hypothetical protein [Streptomyces sp. A108]